MCNIAFNAAVGIFQDPTPQGTFLGATYPDNGNRTIQKADVAALASFAFFKYVFSQTPLVEYSTLIASAITHTAANHWGTPNSASKISTICFANFLYHSSTNTQLALATLLRLALNYNSSLEDRGNIRNAKVFRQAIPAALISSFYFLTLRDPVLPFVGVLFDCEIMASLKTILWVPVACSALQVYFQPEGLDTPRIYFPYLILTTAVGYIALNLFDKFSTRPQQHQEQTTIIFSQTIRHHFPEFEPIPLLTPSFERQFFELLNAAEFVNPQPPKEEQKIAEESLKLQTILEQDPFLKPFECAILQGIALDPCLDPTNPKQLYGYLVLKKWVKKKQTSPTTKAHLSVNEIIRLPKCKRFIEHRIEHIFEKPDETLLKEAEDELKKYRPSKPSTKEEKS